jgi:hypothetical protein
MVGSLQAMPGTRLFRRLGREGRIMGGGGGDGDNTDVRLNFLPHMDATQLVEGYRRCFGVAMTLAVMGYHFQVMTQELSQAIDSKMQPGESREIMPSETGRQTL